MRISDALQMSPIPPLEAEVLLSTAIGKDRTWLIAYGEEYLSADQDAAFQTFISRRRRGEPVAYITGEQEFYGRPFSVDRHVLIPRPSTEGLVSLAMDFLRTPHDEVREIDQGIVAVSKVLKMERVGQGYPCPTRSIADIGTGSGCIAITLACEIEDLRVIATDISREILVIASENAKRHGVANRIRFMQGNLLEPLANVTEPFLVVSNPPYVPEGKALQRDVANFELASALFAGTNGLRVLKALMQEASKHPACVGIVLECQEDQASALLG